MRDLLELTVLDAQAVTIRSVAGADEQHELSIQTRRGTLTLRLINRTAKPLRVIDLRQRDKRKQRKGTLTTVPMHALINGEIG